MRIYLKRRGLEQMLSFKDWIEYSVEERQAILDNIIMGVEDMSILEAIDPNLRVEEPESVDHWRSLQSVWMSTNRRRRHSVISIDNAEDLLARIDERIESRIQRSLSQQAAEETIEEQSTRSLEYSGWYHGRTTLENITNEGPGYALFEDMNAFNGMVHRYMVQPNENTFDSYRNAILHIVNMNPLITELGEMGRISITFEVYHPVNGIQPYTFSASTSLETLQEQIAALMDDEEAAGSGTYTHIREHVVRIFINIIRPSVGYGHTPYSHFFLTYFNVTHSRNKASCFYWCVRKIMQSRHHNKTLRKMIFENSGLVSPSDFSIPISIVGQAFERLEIDVILLCNKEPIIELIRDTINYKYYEDIHYDHVYIFDCYYNNSQAPQSSYANDHKLRIFSNSMPTMSMDGDCGYLIINNTKHYLMIYDKGHYEVVKGLQLPPVCHKCGTTKHTIETTQTDHAARTMCLNTIRAFLGDVVVKNKDTHNVRLVFFDAETVPIDGYHHPYMVSYQVCDLETQQLLEKDTIEEADCFDKFLNKMLQYRGTKYLIGYNSSAFDNYFLMRSMIKYGFHLSSENTVLHNNRILKSWVKGIITWDLYRYVGTSLEEACNSYKLGEYKDDMDHDKVASIWKKHQFKISTYDDEEYKAMNVRKYCEKDVQVTKLLFFTIYKDLYDITSIDPLSKPTLSSLAYAHMMKDWKERNIHISSIPIEYDPVFSSIPGGRTQVFKKGEFKDNSFALLDVNSLYPFTCMTNKFPTSNIIHGKPKNDNQLYIAYCKVDQTCLKYKMIGVKNDEDDRLDWSRNHVEQWLWKEQIDELRNHGCSVECDKYAYWEQDAHIFQIMNTYKKIREESHDNPVRGKNSKKLGNSNTGKMVENNHNDVWEICNDQTDVDRFIRKYQKSDIMQFQTTGVYTNIMMKACKEESKYLNKPKHIGSRIYALSRLYMWKMMMKCENLYYSDTDSLLIDKSEIHKFKIGKEYGEFKVEAESDHIFVVSPKTYWVSEEKHGLKGYKPGDTWRTIRMHEDDNGDYWEFINNGDKITPDIYEALLDPEMIVNSKYHNMRKEFVRKRENKWELFTITGITTTKIIS